MFASLLTRFMHNPPKKHLRTAGRVLRYIQGTLDSRIKYEKRKIITVDWICDNDWSGDESDMKSTSSYGFFICQMTYSTC